ncbi:MAG TPA: hypothetical protein VEQ37_09325 [Actinomycetota bacterium]|nr:hypothetical protein [Actinomycetota bacterium]
MAASPDGTMAVMWYDFTGDRPGDGEVTTETWVARSSGGGHWKLTQLGAPFDILSVPSTAEQPTGDFQSLVPMRNGFEAAFTMANKPDAETGPTDIFAAAAP